ncbi:hypothetical protein M405DRAFT_932062 [Rhizopogon salebrosus TDB-379]|nr:hypothetical protein M405DRAFT_932062 [Rhizopogon salebrosus TDB-379]
MPYAITELLDIFNGRGAFIFAERRERGKASFHVVPCIDIRASGSLGGIDPACSVLIVIEDVYEHTNILMDTINKLASDHAIHTVCTETLALAEYLATEAKKICEDNANVMNDGMSTTG